MKDNFPFPFQKDKKLSELTTLGVGGPARYFTEVKTIWQIQEILTYTYRLGMPTFVLGKGSNSLFDDRGFNGLVILNRINFIHNVENTIHVGSGYSFARLGTMTARKGISGLEFASGIPATVGGAIYMNAGANGHETAEFLKEVGYVNEKGEMIRFLKEDLTFGYRTSSFQQRKGAIVDASFHLNFSDQAKENQRGLLNNRLKTQPYKEKSAGCAFRNPVGFPAGKLIEECGLKGVTIGGASVSHKHANFIVNQGNASAKDILLLIHQIKEQVHQQKGIFLEEEIRYIPYND